MVWMVWEAAGSGWYGSTIPYRRTVLVLEEDNWMSGVLSVTPA